MIALRIKSTKNFMTKLLTTEAFDSFLFEEAVVTMNLVFSIDGHQIFDFYTRQEREEGLLCPYSLVEWKVVREYIFAIIRGKRTPVNFRFVLHLKPEHMKALLEKGDTSVSAVQMRAFVLNIKYDGSELTLISATAANTFLLDKTPDAIWDQAVMRFLDRAGLEYEEA